MFQPEVLLILYMVSFHEKDQHAAAFLVVVLCMHNVVAIAMNRKQQ